MRIKKIVIDMDDTICRKPAGVNYEDAIPIPGVINKLREFKEKEFEICIYTSRNMKTYGGNLGKINANTLPVLINWLNKYNVPYDEIIMGKPWCGDDGFYVDDRAIRPCEFVKL